MSRSGQIRQVRFRSKARPCGDQMYFGQVSRYSVPVLPGDLWDVSKHEFGKTQSVRECFQVLRTVEADGPRN